MVLTASLPSLGEGALKNREDPKILGTAKVSHLDKIVITSTHLLFHMPGVQLAADCQPFLQNFRHRVLPDADLGGHVPLQLKLPGCCVPWWDTILSLRLELHTNGWLLACLPHYTTGQTYFYPAFNAARAEDAIKFAHEFSEVLAMPIMLEAVMRVRVSRGQLS
jgi:protein transport protein SEC24